MFGHQVYSLDGTGPSIEISGLHEDFQHVFWDMGRWNFFRWILQTNKNKGGMEGLRNKAAYTGTFLKST